MQRVTKYPLLLSRLYKATAANHADREAVKHAKERIEAALGRMNKVINPVASLFAFHYDESSFDK